jgi:hypothetical protein
MRREITKPVSRFSACANILRRGDDSSAASPKVQQNTQHAVVEPTQEVTNREKRNNKKDNSWLEAVSRLFPYRRCVSSEIPMHYTHAIHLVRHTKRRQTHTTLQTLLPKNPFASVTCAHRRCFCD